MKLRELRGVDIFILMSIVGKLGIKDEIVALFKRPKKKVPQDKKLPEEERLKKIEEEQKEIGMEFAATLIELLFTRIHLVKDDINQLLSDLACVKVKEIEELPFNEYVKLIKDVFTMAGMRDFLSSILPSQGTKGNINLNTTSSLE